MADFKKWRVEFDDIGATAKQLPSPPGFDRAAAQQLVSAMHTSLTHTSLTVRVCSSHVHPASWHLINFARCIAERPGRSAPRRGGQPGNHAEGQAGGEHAPD